MAVGDTLICMQIHQQCFWWGSSATPCHVHSAARPPPPKKKRSRGLPPRLLQTAARCPTGRQL